MNHKTLIIVESPAKANKIQSFLGEDWIVLASYGHITDLSKKNMGIDIEKDFKPHYVLMSDKVDVLDKIISAAKKSKMIYLCGDNDREGTAISWHIKERLDGIDVPMKRAVFNEITNKAVLKGIKEASDIDMNVVRAQEARRVLDRLVGFSASPFLINSFGPKLSAGRVQSVVTRIVVDREREIETFVPEDFWTIQAILSKDGTTGFVTKFSGRLTDLKSSEDMKTKIAEAEEFIVSSVVSDDEKKNPQPPLITSNLQRVMSRIHGFSSDKTMKAAQSLYESGHCTYIRTDSVRIGDDSLKEVREWLKDNKYVVPKKANAYKNKDAAQDAHECIRPSHLDEKPDNLNSDEKAVYEAIWKYFIASQMMPAVYSTLKVTLHAKGDKGTELKASGKALKEAGFLDILGIKDESKIEIPNLSKGEAVKLFGKNPVLLEKKQTQPPPRYSEDKLIKELDDKGIGRPATYAALLSKITERNYVEKSGNVFHATDLGKKITDVLVSYFTFMNLGYTADLERKLDLIEGGKTTYLEMLNGFYPDFKKELDKAYLNNGGDLCDKCGGQMIIRQSKDGRSFKGCSKYPNCLNIKNL